MKQKILTYLKKTQGYISGEDMSRHLHMSRSAIWKYMEELRNQGYAITAVPHKGYKLVSLPEQVLEHELRYDLQTKTIGKKIFCFDSADTTMNIAFQLGLEGAAEGTVVYAESQKKGKGRMGRTWSSPKGKGIYLSIILRPDLALNDVSRLTLVSAVAICEAIKKAVGLETEIKWPNDILVRGKKLAGILTELSADMDKVRFVIVGMGINVNTSLKVLPENSTSIKNELNQNVSRVVLIQEILKCFESWYFDVLEKGFDPVMKRWKELSSTLGKKIFIKEPHGEVIGKVIDIDEHGGLILKSPEGKLVKRMSGDVVYL